MKKRPSKLDSREERQTRIIKRLIKLKNATANQVIDSLYYDDLTKFGPDGMIEIGWRYYVHLNKFFAVLEREGYITFTGEQVTGELGKKEKVWRVS
jgi:hypothetical protein